MLLKYYSTTEDLLKCSLINTFLKRAENIVGLRESHRSIAESKYSYLIVEKQGEETEAKKKE